MESGHWLSLTYYVLWCVAFTDVSAFILTYAGVESPHFVLVISTRRGASTEAAEHIGSHPCSTSWNELISHSQFPSGYAKYKQSGNYEKYIGVDHLLPIANVSALNAVSALRQSFCNGRPPAVRDKCGDACVIALKIHVDESYPLAAMVALLKSPNTSSVFVVRNATESFCSIRWARSENGSFAHTPNAHAIHGDERPPCIRTDENSVEMTAFEHKVASQLAFGRNTLRDSGHYWFELPFTSFVSDPTRSTNILWSSFGLAVPPRNSEWEKTCPYDYCEVRSWPGLN